MKVIRKWNAINSNSVFKFTFSTILLRHHRIILFYRYHRWDDFHIVLYMQSKAEAILKWPASDPYCSSYHHPYRGAYEHYSLDYMDMET